MSQTSNESIDIKENENVQVKKYAWVILVVVYLAGIAAPMNMSKVSPIMPEIMEDFQLDLTQAGSVMSVFSFAGILLSIPAGMIVEKLGYKLAGLISLACLALGSALGAISGTYFVLIGSRVIEGVGFGLLGVISPAIISLWFPKEKQGIPMAVWSTWFSIGMITIYLLAPNLVSAFGWRAVWWFGTIYSLVLMLAYGIFVKNPESSMKSKQANKATSVDWKALDIKNGLKNKNIWLVTLAAAILMIVVNPLMTYLPTFLYEVRGFSLSAAANVSSLGTALTIFSALLTGWLLDKYHKPKLIMTVAFIAYSFLAIFIYRAEGWMMYGLVVVHGFLGSALPTVAYSSVGKLVKDPKWMGISLGIIGTGMNSATLIGPIIFGNLVEKYGWTSAALCLVPVLFLGIVVSRIVKIE